MEGSWQIQQFVQKCCCLDRHLLHCTPGVFVHLKSKKNIYTLQGTDLLKIGVTVPYSMCMGFKRYGFTLGDQSDPSILKSTKFICV